MAALRVHLYRYRHPDGAEKDWAYPVLLAPNAFTAFYGRTGAALRQADTPAIRCRGGDPASEAQARVQEKRAKGYRDLGEFWLAADRRQLTPADSPAPVGPDRSPAEPALRPPCWYWRWMPGSVATDTTQRQAVVEAACTAALARLTAVGWSMPDHRPGDDGPALWARLTEATRSGVVEQRAGNEPQLAFWLLVARRCPADLRLVDDAQRPVRDWPAALPVDSALLETLGLQPQDLGALLAAGQDGETWFF